MGSGGAVLAGGGNDCRFGVSQPSKQVFFFFSDDPVRIEALTVSLPGDGNFMLQRTILLFSVIPILIAADVGAADPFAQDVVPFAARYCNRCHNSQESRGELNLTEYSRAADVARHFRRWNNIVRFIRSGEMPPEDARPQPTSEERERVAKAVEAILRAEALKHAGDPGIVLPRRLSNTEYDLSVRDLIGVDIRPTLDFPVDPAGGEGFDNTGESLTMSPSLLRKYLQAAEHVSNHLVLKTEGISFASFPVTSYNERRKLTEQAIIEFYQRHEVRIREYLQAAWRYRHRSSDDRGVTVDAWAERSHLSARYLRLVWSTLNQARDGFGYVRQLGELWDALPAPEGADDIPAELQELNRFVEFCRQRLNQPEGQLIKSNAGNWPIQHLDFRAKTAAQRDQFSRTVFQTKTLLRFERLRGAKAPDSDGATVFLRIDPAFEGRRRNYVVFNRPLISQSGNLPRNASDEKKQQVETLKSVLQQYAPEAVEKLNFGRHPLGQEIDAESFVVEAPALIEIPLSTELLKKIGRRKLLIPAELDSEHGRQGSIHLRSAVNGKPDESSVIGAELLVHPDSEVAKRMATSAELFCGTFPNRFSYVNPQRGLAAGFHLVEGFFRDDRPLVTKVLTESEVQELDGLWRELEFVTGSTETLIRGFVWFERSERHVLHDKRFDFLRPEDPKLVENELLTRFEKVYLDKMGIRLVEDSLEPEKPSDTYEMIHGFFEQIRGGLKRFRRLMTEAERHGLRDLEEIAARAWHRPLTERDVASLHKLYQALRDQGRTVEESLRGVMTAILMSPDFCYRYSGSPSGREVTLLSNGALAARLSYFLWSSLPDEELLKVAREGKLQTEAGILKQTRRMLQDDRIAAFAREFPGQWLRYRDYLSNDSIVGESFPGYDEHLKRAMFEEPARLVTYLIQKDRPVTELLTTDGTFVNETLARHYGGTILKQYQQRVRAKGRERESAPWLRIDGLRSAGRGGLFGMGVILAKNSAGQRTSPVKRGFWTVHHLLGQHFPPPPADVPELPTNEKEAKQTIRELMNAHTADAKCAMCHRHFDSLGLAMEGFDPIGRVRTKDLAGRPIDNVATLPNGTTAKGIPGLIDYVDGHRRKDFVRTLCRKFLGYALGRSVMLSDQPLLDEMELSLEKSSYRFSILFEKVVTSPQFRRQRGQDFVAAGG